MAELNLGALTDSSSYTGSLSTANIYDLYKFNINSPGSFTFAIDNLSGNADIFLLNNSGATLESSTNAGNAAETINADSLVAGDYTLKVLQITGDIKYTLNLAPTDTQTTSEADTLTGAKSDSPLDSNTAATLEKTTANKDVITGDAVDDETVTAEAKTATTEDPVSTTSETTVKSEPEKTVTETASAIATSETTDKAVSSSSETTIKSEAEKTVTATTSPTSETLEKSVTTSAETTIKTEPKTSETAGEIVAINEPKTSETVADLPVASKSEEKPNTATTNGEDKKTENANTAVPTAETTEKLEPTNKELAAANPFTTGVFVVDSTGKVSIDYILDGGLYRGQLAIISLKGMEKFVPGSAEFFKEAAARAMSNSEKGYIVIDDLTEGAKFNGNLPEGNFNEGEHLKVKTFAMTPGDEFGFMLVPNDTVKFLYDYPTFGGDKRPLFSMVTANPNEAFHLGQIVDINGEGNTFAMEDLRFDLGTDKDYNDIVFQVWGARGKAPLMDGLVNPDKDWRQTDLGKAVTAYTKPYVTPETETKPNLEGKVTGIIDELEDAILTPVTAEKEPPKNTETTGNADKDTTDRPKIVPTNKVDEKPTSPAVATEEKVKDNANNSGDSTEVETTEKVDPKAVPTAEKDTGVDPTEKLPVEKTPVSPGAIEETDKVAETPPATPGKSATETEVAATKPTEKVETKPEVLPAETKAKEESKPTVVTEVEKTETTQVVAPKNAVESVNESQPTATVESQETAGVKPSLTVKESDRETMPVTAVNQGEAPPTKEIVTETETPAVSDVIAPKESQPISPIVDESTDSNSTAGTEVGNPDRGNPSPDIAAPESELDFSVSAELIARLERMKQSLNDNRSADDPSQGSSADWIVRLDKLTERLLANPSATVSNNTVTLVSRLEETIDRLIQPPIQPTLPSIETARFDFPAENQPIIGVIDTGFAGNNPDIDYSRITWGQDRVDGDADPIIEPGKGNEHGTHVLGIIAATQNNAIGIDGINEKAPVWAGRAIGSGKWAESLVEYVDFVKTSGQKNGVINLSMDLTQINPDGSTTTRYEFTPEERSAIEYARQNGVAIVVAAGNDGGVMSALGQSSQEFDNIITVGAAERINDEIAVSKAFDRTDYSSYGQGLDILAPGGTVENPELSTVGDGVGTMAGTSVATAKITGAISQVWAANPSLNYRQVIQIIKDTATDLKTHNWDGETGAGLLNIEAAVSLAKAITPEEHEIPPIVLPETWSGNGLVIPMEREVRIPYTFRSGDTLWAIARRELGDGNRWVEIQKENGSTYTSQEARNIAIGTLVYLPGNSPTPIPTPPPTPTPVGSLTGKKIALDPGHGKSPGRFDPGAVGYGTTEAAENMVQAEIIANYLRQRGAEVKIIDDGSLGLEQIGQQSSGSDLFVSLHLNAFNRSAQGHEVYSHTSAPAIDSNLARTINSELDAVFPDSEIPNRGAKTANFGVLRGAPTAVPAVLVESLFIDAPGMSRANVEKAAGAIARGIEKFLTGNISNPAPGNGSGSSTVPATPGQQRQYIIKSGDTLTGIAQRELGNANRWREIVKTPTGGTFTEAEARQLRVGQSVYLPVNYQSGSGTPVKQVPTTNPNQTNFEIGRVSSRVGSIPLNLRRQPNTSQAPIGTLPVGKQLKILRTVNGGTYTAGNASRSDWYEVEVDGKRGFVAAYYIDKGSSAPPPPESGFVNSNVGGGPLRLRSSASTNAGIITQLNQGTNLKILRSVTGGTYQPGNRSDWYEVEVNGKRGFVAAYYVTKGTNPGSGGGNSGNPQTWQNPLPGYPVTSGYGWRGNPFNGTQEFHWGIDIGTSGTTPPVKAAKSGKVFFAGWNNQGYGNLVIVEHGDGTRSYYAHLSSIAVSTGASINGGANIGNVGSTGYSTGNHLHFEIRVAPYRWQTDNRNPRNYINF